MSKKRGARAATVAAAAIVGCAGSAEATNVITVPLSSVLGNGGEFTGSFDISSLLNDGTHQYQATDAKIQVAGTSDFGTTDYIVTGYYSYSYSCGSWWSSHTCYASGAYYANHDGQQDSLQLSAGGQFATAYDSPSGTYSDYYGSLLATLLLSGADLTTANSTGNLAFAATASTNTNVRLNSATLTINLQESTGAVPEPSTWAMMLLGFGGVGIAVRRDRRRAKRVALA